MSLRKKPWNRTNQPVYSISSGNGKDFNMHIISYVTPISMQPKQYVVGIYHGTKTLELIEENPVFILQLLDEKQSNLIQLLGKQSGHSINKIERLRKRALLAEWNKYPILKDSLSIIQLKASVTLEGGDHKALLCEVMAYKNLNEGTPLTLDYLRAKKIIRG
jgi:flavin reductase (DIM6/NTAB) family NADH-FMN oxidoreductase RutF